MFSAIEPAHVLCIKCRLYPYGTTTAYASARAMQPDTIPVIDITPLIDGSDPVSVAQALHQVSAGLGFIYIKGHGIPEEIIKATSATAYQFFGARPDEKESVKISDKHRGWLGAGNAPIH